jgi:hypothetical protein
MQSNESPDSAKVSAAVILVSAGVALFLALWLYEKAEDKGYDKKLEGAAKAAKRLVNKYK